MPVIPVRYESLKAILPYMEPNTRFQISLRIPSVSSLESRIPLKIENLAFTGLETKVNEVSYQVRVNRDYGRNETPSDVHRMNQRGGSNDDIDQYGVIIFPGLDHVLPGDIDLRNRVHRDIPENTEGQAQHLVNVLSGDIDLRTTVQRDHWFNTEESEQTVVQQLRVFKMLLAERLNQEYIEDDETRNAVVGGAWNALVETYRIMTLNYSVETIQNRIQSLRDSLRPFNNRRDNRIPPSTAWIQFTTRSPKGITIQRVAYNKYLYEARKTVHTKLFGNRGSSISVKNLNIIHHDRILRFPAATIFKIENLEVTNWNSREFERFKQVIHPSSLPIRRLKVSSSVFTADFQHAIAREAKYLIIDNAFANAFASWTPILLNLTNRRVCLKNENTLNSPNNYMDLIENWLQQGRPVGTCFHMGIKNEETVKQCLDTLKQRQEVIGSSEKQVQLRINAALMLEVSYEMIEQPGRLLRDDQGKWWLRLRVVRRRYD
ncbi:hypothetical protein GCK72_004366 [Caenorhabditis remanei]|uniref:Uncharacterized protein n=1 Tax=Caenorhabditis remanei TaxID=31234 RepID=A0A6A5H9K1_CAERE|nr:hypothetical protein GCK72_004366 [Caenorhabditis remanei]KAF1764418.1 hypothetical protein GCK72_004366 [Caenorhabditis remanei]